MVEKFACETEDGWTYWSLDFNEPQTVIAESAELTAARLKAFGKGSVGDFL